MIRTLPLATAAALMLAVSPVLAQNASTGAVQPSAPPAPQQGVSSGGVANPTTTSAGSPEATKPVGSTAAASPAAGAGKSGSLSAADKTFVMHAAAGGLAEVKEGQLAQNQAQSSDVKAFGQHMVDDHTAANDKLKSIAQAEGVQPPADLPAAQAKQVAALQKLKGKAFDRRYVKDQVKAHEQTVALFKKEAASGSDPQLKQFASDTLPTLQEHLKSVKALDK